MEDLDRRIAAVKGNGSDNKLNGGNRLLLVAGKIFESRTTLRPANDQDLHMPQLHSSLTDELGW